MGRRKVRNRRIVQIKLVIGNHQEMFRLENELLVDRDDSVRRVYELHNLAQAHIQQADFFRRFPSLCPAPTVTVQREPPDNRFAFLDLSDLAGTSPPPGERESESSGSDGEWTSAIW
jgi:hypothetical protein